MPSRAMRARCSATLSDGFSPMTGLPPPPSASKIAPCVHITPFGMPVVPPV